MSAHAYDAGDLVTIRGVDYRVVKQRRDLTDQYQTCLSYEVWRLDANGCQPAIVAESALDRLHEIPKNNLGPSQ
ncbi:MAG: hypothetical protein H6981_07250 [Gammaproteobacteria bacterium]|nr:hypothetical protein [Gammaproteobacteria bacterium]